jgi:hypothetical protein
MMDAMGGQLKMMGRQMELSALAHHGALGVLSPEFQQGRKLVHAGKEMQKA